MLAVVTNLLGWRVASPASDLEKAPDADWPLYPTTLPVLPVMFGVRTSAVDLNITRGPRKEPGRFMKELAEFLKQEVIPTGTAVMP